MEITDIKSYKSKGKRTHQLIALSQVDTAAISWLIEGVTAKGIVSIITGDPGCGKTWFALEIAARLSRKKVNTLYLTDENPYDTVIKPRAEILHADTNHIFYAGENKFTLESISELVECIKLYNIDLLILDPLQDFLGTLNMNEMGVIRVPLQQLIKETGVAVILLTHMNKNSGESDLKKSTGSIDIVALARIAFSVTSSIDEDPYIRDCIVKQIKTNLPVSVAPLGYRLNQKEGSFSWITGQLKDDTMEIESWLGKVINYVVAHGEWTATAQEIASKLGIDSINPRWIGREIRKGKSMAVLEENNISVEMLPRKKYGQPLFFKYKGGVPQERRPTKRQKSTSNPLK